MDQKKIIERFDLAIRFFLYVLIFWLPYSNAVIESCVIAALVVFLVKRLLLLFFNFPQTASIKEKIRRIFKSFRPVQTALDIPIVLFLITCLISVAVSFDKAQSFHSFFSKTLEWFVIYYLAIEAFTKKKHLYIALGVFLFTAVSTAVDSIVQFHISGMDVFNKEHLIDGRATGGFHHPNGLGAYLAVIIPLFLPLWLVRAKKRTTNTLILCSTSLLLWSLAISFSRGAWAATFLASLPFLLIVKRKQRIFGVIITLCLAFGLYSFFGHQKDYLKRTSLYDIKLTAVGRTLIWEDNLEIIAQKPIWGYGLNTYMRVFERYQKKKYNGRLPYGVSYAHNCYLQLWAETGIAGLLSFLLIIMQFFNTIRKNIFAILSRDFNLYLILSGLSMGILGFLIHSFVDTDLYSLQLSSLFWLTIGCAISVVKIYENQTKKQIQR